MSVGLASPRSRLGFAVAVGKRILGREIQGRIERRITRSVEATIASLPDALQEEHAEEWRAEFAAVIAMPIAAAASARGLREAAMVVLPSQAFILATTNSTVLRGLAVGKPRVDRPVVRFHAGG